MPAETPILIVEGVGAGRRSLVPYLDAICWVQSDAAEARRRGIARDGATAEAVAFWNEWDAEEIPFQGRSAHGSGRRPSCAGRRTSSGWATTRVPRSFAGRVED